MPLIVIKIDKKNIIIKHLYTLRMFKIYTIIDKKIIAFVINTLTYCATLLGNTLGKYLIKHKIILDFIVYFDR